MRPLRIRLVNFGPYKDQTIDFEDFNDAPLFLISGKTGSGKTTIFDAMCFALFGRSSGGDRNPDEMRSDFADQTEETFVTFIFEHHGQQYVINRKPKQILAKKRGTGTTEQVASVDLTVTDRDGKEQSWTKRGTVDQKLFDLLHLTPAQFTQIVLLPQGQFRHFLEANSNDKEALLADLFGTDLYKRWANNLNDQLKAMRQASKDQSTQLATYAKMIKWQDDTEIPVADAPATDILAALIRQNEAMEPELAQRRQVNDKESARLSQLTTQVKTEESLLAIFNQREQAQLALSKLNQQMAYMDKLAAHMKQLEWVQQTLPLQEKAVETKQQETRTTERLASTKTSLITAQQTLTDAVAVVEQLNAQKPEEAKRQSELTRLKQVRPLFETVATLSKQQVAQQQQLKAAQTNAELTTKQLSEQQQLRDQLDQQLTTLQSLDAKQLTVRDQQHALKTLTDQQADLDQQQHALQMRHQRTDKTAQQLAELIAKQKDAADRYQQLDHDWTVGQIQRLSAKLEDGEPCPVCGSTEHPKVAVATVTDVTEDELKEADKQRQDINQRVANVTGQLNELKAAQEKDQSAYEENESNWAKRIAQLTDQSVTTDNARDVLSQFKQQLANAVQQLNDALEHRTQLQQQLAVVKPQLETLTAQRDEANKKVQRVQTELTTVTAQLADRRHDLPDQFNDLASLDAHIKQVEQASQSYIEQTTKQQTVQNKAQQNVTQLQTQVTSLTQTQAEQHKNAVAAQQTFDEALNKHRPVVELAAFNQLANEVTELDEQRKVHQRFLTDKSRASAQVETLTKQIGDQTKPNVEETVKAREAQTEKQRTAQQAFYEFQQMVQSNEDVATKMKTLMDESREAQQQLAEMAELADTATGRSDMHLSLERYILQTYLQKVLTVANVRLAVLTNKRYQFRLDTSAGSRATDTGLEINVFDDQAGKVRSVHTLSGGESFIAALSLALALGEVIQSEAGGITIEALFVDEGFGSLDGEALQMAMEALQTIEGNNRMIGIISHVTEMQEQIPDQLQVVSLANGQSTIKYQHEL
ncbi:AAA family ATPase [Furfurilactobacillus milii]|uniref:Nuclease SbcCD subunit C n=1 Tax=Furfurilactobacillus milii TaxID=2888272 RepID=A0A6N9I547_9LACO|nr:SMC family ATPase [Furfurilactobacillus milii]MYV17814.1 AAA family ATPase [Furfurilactobacillus milii]